MSEGLTRPRKRYGVEMRVWKMHIVEHVVENNEKMCSRKSHLRAPIFILFLKEEIMIYNSILYDITHRGQSDITSVPVPYRCLNGIRYDTHIIIRKGLR